MIPSKVYQTTSCNSTLNRQSSISIRILFSFRMVDCIKTNLQAIKQSERYHRIRRDKTLSRLCKQVFSYNINYMIENTYEVKCFQSGIYLIVKEIQDPKGYQLQAGDLVKLGKMEYQVVELRQNKKTYFAKNYFSKSSSIPKHNKQFTCKFCYSDSTEDKFLFGICKCQGNIEPIHFNCLKFWIDSNIKRDETHFGLVLKWTKAFQCNVCKDNLPMRIKDYQELFTLERPDVDYLILEQINREKEQGQEIYLIHEFLNDPIKIGRAPNCEIKASDITVSRHHASIYYKNHNFYLTDNNSKFGTLIGLNEQQAQQIRNLELINWAFQFGKYIIKCAQTNENNQNVYKCSPSTQHKLTQLPQISKHDEEEEPQMDESFDNK